MRTPRTISLPLVVLIAVAALVLGSFGTAHAAALTAKSVKKIAAKVVAKKAPGLSVAHADTASVATKADTAAKADTATKSTTATSATTAGDASKLAGQDPQLYLDRMGFVASNHVGVGADTGNLMATVSITVPQGASIIHVLGTASIPAGTGETATLWTRVDSTDCSSLSGTDWDRRSRAKGSTTLTTQYATPTTAGAHTVVLCASNTTTGVFADGVTLAVETVPRGSSGGGSL
jgi:hypothetical protein